MKLLAETQDIQVEHSQTSIPHRRPCDCLSHIPINSKTRQRFEEDCPLHFFDFDRISRHCEN